MQGHVSVQLRGSSKTLPTNCATEVRAVSSFGMFLQSSLGAKVFVANDTIFPTAIFLVLVSSFLFVKSLSAFPLGTIQKVGYLKNERKRTFFSRGEG